MKLPALSGSRETVELTDPVFIADLHLSGKTPKTLRKFLFWLFTRALLYRELVILGDFFAYWIGDDAADAARPIARILRLYTLLGKRLYFMQGNRDVVLGEDFPRSCGGVLLAPQTVALVRGRRLLLSHGDEWCTLDAEYQKLRAMLRDPAWQEQAFAMSVPERIEWVKRIQAESQTQKSVKSAAEMDVVASEVEKSARSAHCDAVIHGHTHHPGAHEDEAVPRYVIPDWELENGSRHGWIDIARDGTVRVHAFA